METIETMETIAAPAVPRAARRRSAMTQLVITELKLFTRGRAAVGLGLSAGIPLLLVIIFGGIHSFKTPVKAFGGLTTLDVYIPILLVFAMALLSLVALPATLATYRELGVLRGSRPRPRVRSGCLPLSSRSRSPSPWSRWCCSSPWPGSGTTSLPRGRSAASSSAPSSRPPP
jgi:hypothetical protein